MILCITIPRFLMRTAMIGPHGQAGRLAGVADGHVRDVRGAARSAARRAAVAAAAAEGHPSAQRMIDALPSPISPPSEAGQRERSPAAWCSAAAASPRTTGQVVGPGSGGGKGPSARGRSQARAQARRREQGAAAALRPPASRRSACPGIERPAFDREAVDQAWQAMHAASRHVAADREGGRRGDGASSRRRHSAGSPRSAARTRAKMRQFAAQHLPPRA